ncbi:TonB family protein [Aggregicoccus sp. 17bor-14]|uniref:energy transducer TonB n=1 Tax=Myxococcaceae TaxID=31 RepID=UPI00129C9295|nr:MULTISPECIES: energy transducer TonB [Myxococcaceae]MBF5046176.1 TonB family protein [Simulacricoccus sp. 17bor-14]MRI91901.1 TonB family protein [Aggregicoccus sp. 17bor-14]
MPSAAAHETELLQKDRGRARRSPWLFLLVSVGLHAAAFVAMSRMEARAPAPLNKAVELVMVEVQKPPPPPPPAEPKKEEPPRPAPRPVRPPPVKVAAAAKPPPPQPEAPPPPNDAPPPQPAKAPLVVGISMSSTTTAGTFSAPVGNTAYGKTADKAQAPAAVKPYSAARYVPVYQVDSAPAVLSEYKPPYPPEARRAQVEGQVVLSITVDSDGRVVAVKVLSGPGYGLDEAARDALRRFRFRPATKGGEPVATELKYTYTFQLD